MNHLIQIRQQKECWIVSDNNEDGWTWATNYTAAPYNGDMCAEISTFNSSGQNDDYLISSPIVLTGNEVLTFYAAAQSAVNPNDYEIRISTTGANPADFNTVLFSETLNSSTFAEKTVDLTAYSDTVFIAFYVPVGPTGYRVRIDEFCVDLEPCSENYIYHVNFINVTPTSASFNWNTSGFETSWDMKYQEIAPVSMPEVIESGLIVPAYTLNSLTPNSTYEVYVRGNCGMGATAWQGPYVFTAKECDLILNVTGTPESGPHFADQKITSDAVIQTGKTSQYQAGTCIELNAGFEVELGSQFEAKMLNCRN